MRNVVLCNFVLFLCKMSKNFDKRFATIFGVKWQIEGFWYRDRMSVSKYRFMQECPIIMQNGCTAPT